MSKFDDIDDFAILLATQDFHIKGVIFSCETVEQIQNTIKWISFIYRANKRRIELTKGWWSRKKWLDENQKLFEELISLSLNRLYKLENT